jgi:predicted metal-dependent phosphoesterase TrpH
MTSPSPGPAARRGAAAADDPWALNADLHCHSAISDGTLSPEAVVARAHAQGVQMLSLTDHDELAGQAAALETARKLGIAYVPGIEISVTWAGETIHVLGLGIDPDDAALAAGVAGVRAGREARAREMAAQLEAAGIVAAWEGALRHVRNPQLISRTHFARFLVEAGHCADLGEVFLRYLTQGRPGYVPHRWARLSEAVGWILGAGGTAVLAHPGRYRLGDVGLWALLQEFREAGGSAIEVICGSHTRDQYARFARMAREFDFRASRGSDFHGPGESRVELGALPPLPDAVVPVWAGWAAAIDA